MIKSANFLLIIIFVLQSIIGLVFNSGNFSYLFNIVVSQIFALLVPLVLFMYVNKRKAYIKTGDFKAFHAISAILCTVSINVISQYINIPVLSFMAERKMNTPIIFMPNGAFELAAYFLLIALVPPIIEEFLFRKALLDEYRGAYGDLKAIVLCGLSFALLHTNPASFLPQFFMGMFFSYLAVKTGGILLPVICHFVHNASLVLIQNLFYDEFTYMLENNILLNLLIFSSILLFGIYTIGKSVKGHKKNMKIYTDAKLTSALYLVFLSVVLAFNIIFT